MLNRIRLEPDQVADYTSSHAGRGADYDDKFDRLPFRRLLWALEQRALRELLPRTGAKVAVDLACGTGRITRVLTEALPDAEVIGVDVAETMLARARESVPAAQFLCADVRNLVDALSDRDVDLVTAFRFFANADGPLRSAATETIAALVRPGGFLLMNNHRNYWSPSYVARRVRFGNAPGARNGDIVGPFRKLGFEVVTRRSLGVVLHTDAHAYLLPMTLAAGIERVNLRTSGRFHALGTDTLWLLRRRPSPGSRPEVEA